MPRKIYTEIDKIAITLMQPECEGYEFNEYRHAKQGELIWNQLTEYVCQTQDDNQYPGWIATKEKKPIKRGWEFENARRGVKAVEPYFSCGQINWAVSDDPTRIYWIATKVKKPVVPGWRFEDEKRGIKAGEHFSLGGISKAIYDDPTCLYWIATRIEEVPKMKVPCPGYNLHAREKEDTCNYGAAFTRCPY